jgi:uncharacterized protein YbbK (DUF523 family)
MTRVLVSSCLLGERVRFNGSDARANSAMLDRWLSEDRVVAFCPEVAGGLPVPRPAAEISGGEGLQVLDHRAVVLTRTGQDVTEFFVRGARLALEAARECGATIAVLKEGSPSCGSSRIYDGAFQGVSKSGAGVTTELLRQHGIAVFSENELDLADAALRAAEARTQTR